MLHRIQLRVQSDRDRCSGSSRPNDKNFFFVIPKMYQLLFARCLFFRSVRNVNGIGIENAMQDVDYRGFGVPANDIIYSRPSRAYVNHCFGPLFCDFAVAVDAVSWA